MPTKIEFTAMGRNGSGKILIGSSKRYGKFAKRDDNARDIAKGHTHKPASKSCSAPKRQPLHEVPTSPQVQKVIGIGEKTFGKFLALYTSFYERRNSRKN